ncbi:hypothetical protein IAD21_04511 [Abditibacteriota bacterium]|nr:hypothetical protein IAD21_04511 [Abditibacteriota bacterium]
MNIIESTEQYEQWLEQQLAVESLEIDHSALRVKHDEMAKAPFAFFRATFYRWAQCWPKRSHPWCEAPEVLAIGDLHAENFGTWRDSEGRLVWGINDFDEVALLPYTNDLVRLAVSAQLAINGNHYLALDFRTACEQILAGYEETLRAGKKGASPWVLSEKNDWLREIAAAQVRDPNKFWDKLKRHQASSDSPALTKKVETTKSNKASPQKSADKEKATGSKLPLQPNDTSGDAFQSTLSAASTPDEATALKVSHVPDSARKAIESHLPLEFQVTQWKRRQAGLGSLGRPRFVVLGTWQGARLAREGKALVPAAASWLNNSQEMPLNIGTFLKSAVRCPDPHFTIQGRWLVRRLAPDCTKLELFDIPKRYEEQFLFAMGRETANLHLSSDNAIPAVLKHLKNLPPDWLEEAAEECVARVMKDWTIWREHNKLSSRKK